MLRYLFMRTAYIAFSLTASFVVAAPSDDTGAQRANAQFERARKYLYGLDAREDPLQALVLFRQAAEAGNAEAQYHLGWLCWHADSPPLSFGVNIDAYLREAVRCHAEAKQWLDKAAAQGEWRAQELLVQLAAEQTLPREPIFFCLPSNGSQANDWIAAAAEAGNRDAQAEQKARADTPPIESRSMLNRDDYDERLARARAEQNSQLAGEIKRDARADMKRIVAALQNAEPPSALLSERVIPWLRRAAEAGDTEARKELEELTRATQGKPRDEYRTLKWVEAAAKRGEARAQYDLGYLYASGRCLSPDVDDNEIVSERHARAYYWFTQARKGLPAVERALAETALAGLIASYEQPDRLAAIQNRARALHEVAGKPVPSKTRARTYASRDAALHTACDDTTPPKWTGPWTVNGAKAHIGVLWSEGQRTACLGYVLQQPAGFRVAASTLIPAGFSARYSEYWPPEILNRAPMLLRGQTLFMIRTGFMGLGGGGGAEIQIWSVQADNLRQVFSHYPQDFTNINTWETALNTEPACEPPKDGLIFDGDRLLTRACFDGKVQPTKSYRFDGKRFIQIQ